MEILIIFLIFVEYGFMAPTPQDGLRDGRQPRDVERHPAAFHASFEHPKLSHPWFPRLIPEQLSLGLTQTFGRAHPLHELYGDARVRGRHPEDMDEPFNRSSDPRRPQKKKKKKKGSKHHKSSIHMNEEDNKSVQKAKTIKIDDTRKEDEIQETVYIIKDLHGEIVVDTVERPRKKEEKLHHEENRTKEATDRSPDGSAIHGIKMEGTNAASMPRPMFEEKTHDLPERGDLSGTSSIDVNPEFEKTTSSPEEAVLLAGDQEGIIRLGEDGIITRQGDKLLDISNPADQTPVDVLSRLLVDDISTTAGDVKAISEHSRTNLSPEGPLESNIRSSSQAIDENQKEMKTKSPEAQGGPLLPPSASEKSSDSTKEPSPAIEVKATDNKEAPNVVGQEAKKSEKGETATANDVATITVKPEDGTSIAVGIKRDDFPGENATMAAPEMAGVVIRGDATLDTNEHGENKEPGTLLSKTAASNKTIQDTAKMEVNLPVSPTTGKTVIIQSSPPVNEPEDEVKPTAFIISVEERVLDVVTFPSAVKPQTAGSSEPTASSADEKPPEKTEELNTKEKNTSHGKEPVSQNATGPAEKNLQAEGFQLSLLGHLHEAETVNIDKAPENHHNQQINASIIDLPVKESGIKVPLLIADEKEPVKMSKPSDLTSSDLLDNQSQKNDDLPLSSEIISSVSKADQQPTNRPAASHEVEIIHKATKGLQKKDKIKEELTLVLKDENSKAGLLAVTDSSPQVDLKQEDLKEAATSATARVNLETGKITNVSKEDTEATDVTRQKENPLVFVPVHDLKDLGSGLNKNFTIKEFDKMQELMVANANAMKSICEKVSEIEHIIAQPPQVHHPITETVDNQSTTPKAPEQHAELNMTILGSTPISESKPHEVQATVNADESDQKMPNPSVETNKGVATNMEKTTDDKGQGNTHEGKSSAPAFNRTLSLHTEQITNTEERRKAATEINETEKQKLDVKHEFPQDRGEQVSEIKQVIPSTDTVDQKELRDRIVDTVKSIVTTANEFSRKNKDQVSEVRSSKDLADEKQEPITVKKVELVDAEAVVLSTLGTQAANVTESEQSKQVVEESEEPATPPKVTIAGDGKLHALNITIEKLDENSTLPVLHVQEEVLTVPSFDQHRSADSARSSFAEKDEIPSMEGSKGDLMLKQQLSVESSATSVITDTHKEIPTAAGTSISEGSSITDEHERIENFKTSSVEQQIVASAVSREFLKDPEKFIVSVKAEKGEGPVMETRLSSFIDITNTTGFETSDVQEKNGTLRGEQKKVSAEFLVSQTETKSDKLEGPQTTRSDVAFVSEMVKTDVSSNNKDELAAEEGPTRGRSQPTDSSAPAGMIDTETQEAKQGTGEAKVPVSENAAKTPDAPISRETEVRIKNDQFVDEGQLVLDDNREADKVAQTASKNLDSSTTAKDDINHTFQPESEDQSADNLMAKLLTKAETPPEKEVETIAPVLEVPSSQATAVSVPERSGIEGQFTDDRVTKANKGETGAVASSVDKVTDVLNMPQKSLTEADDRLGNLVQPEVTAVKETPPQVTAVKVAESLDSQQPEFTQSSDNNPTGELHQTSKSLNPSEIQLKSEDKLKSTVIDKEPNLPPPRAVIQQDTEVKITKDDGEGVSKTSTSNEKQDLQPKAIHGASVSNTKSKPIVSLQSIAVNIMKSSDRTSTAIDKTDNSPANKTMPSVSEQTVNLGSLRKTLIQVDVHVDRKVETKPTVQEKELIMRTMILNAPRHHADLNVMITGTSSPVPVSEDEIQAAVNAAQKLPIPSIEVANVEKTTDNKDQGPSPDEFRQAMDIVIEKKASVEKPKIIKIHNSKAEFVEKKTQDEKPLLRFSELKPKQVDAIKNLLVRKKAERMALARVGKGQPATSTERDSLEDMETTTTAKPFRPTQNQRRFKFPQRRRN